MSNVVVLVIFQDCYLYSQLLSHGLLLFILEGVYESPNMRENLNCKLIPVLQSLLWLPGHANTGWRPCEDNGAGRESRAL